MKGQEIILADTRNVSSEVAATDYLQYRNDAADQDVRLTILQIAETELDQIAARAGITDRCIGMLLLRDPASDRRSEDLETFFSALELPIVEVFIDELGNHLRIDFPQADRKIIRTIYGRQHRSVFWAVHLLKHCRDHPYRTLAYGHTSSHIGDLFLPNVSGPFPIVMLIHGGFWRDGYYRDSMHGLGADLARLGIAAWNIEYRRVGPSGGGYPETQQDVFAALNFLRHLAQDYPLDLSRVGVVGHSAGGYLSLWGSSLPNGSSATDMPDVEVAVKVGISLAGVSDLDEAHTYGGGDQAATHFLKGAADDETRRRQLSAGYLHYAPGTHLILAHGTDDDYVPVELSEYTFRLLQEKGDDAVLSIFPQTGHNEFVDPTSKVWADMAGRIVAHLQP